jgi:hypothetical protein
MIKKLLLIPLLLLSTVALASAPTRTYTYVSHTVIDPNQNNTNENSLYSYLQNGVDTYAAGTITNTAINSSAAIAYSKLNLLNSVVNADINSSAAIAYSKLNLTGNIVNADISSSAAIVGSKLDLTSPGAIGSTAANTGSFTTLKVGTTHQGDVLYDNGTSFVRLTPGTNGQYLQTQGASANPQWASVPAISGILGTWASATLGSSTQVTTDGFLVGYAIGDGAHTDTITIKTDSSNPPTTIRSQVITGTITAGSYSVPLFSPVKKNDYYLIEKSGTGSNYTVYFIPLGT